MKLVDDVKPNDFTLAPDKIVLGRKK